MSWNNKKVLVIGGAGMIGRSLCRQLGERGAVVTILDNFYRAGTYGLANKKGLEWCEWWPGSATDFANVWDAAKKKDIRYIQHF